MIRRLFLPLIAAATVTACETPVEAPLTERGVVLFEAENTPRGEALAPTSSSYVFPSTNEANFNANLPHVLYVDAAVGAVTLKFVNCTNSLAYFEHRLDGVTPADATTPHPVVTDDVIFRGGTTIDNRGTGICSETTRTFEASETVDIRLALGGERDWDFDWTRFYVLSLENKDQCRDGAWEALGFKNLGQCIRFVETGDDSR